MAPAVVRGARAGRLARTPPEAAVMAVAPKVTLVTMAVSGPHDQGTWWRWEVDGPGGMEQGHEATEAEAWATARRRAVGVLGRLEAPLGGHTLADAIAGPTPPRCLP